MGHFSHFGRNCHLGHFGQPFPSQGGGHADKKSHLGSCLNQQDRATCGFVRVRSRGKQGHKFHWRGCDSGLKRASTAANARLWFRLCEVPGSLPRTGPFGLSSRSAAHITVCHLPPDHHPTLVRTYSFFSFISVISLPPEALDQMRTRIHARARFGVNVPSSPSHSTVYLTISPVHFVAIIFPG